MKYTGRFAPSPTGELHFGSLVSALASYLDARANQGRWLVRIEDIDPPREVAGAADTILRQLEQHGLLWDSEVLYQHDRLDAYHEVLSTLTKRELIYPCQCSRTQLRELGSIYSGHCLQHPPPADAETALRVKTSGTVSWNDRIQGGCEFRVAEMQGDFVVLRKDGLISYQLAVALDDADGQITHVVRGADLLNSTPRQLHLMQLLGLTPPSYGHIPVVLDERGIKLSKQFGALPVESSLAADNLYRGLQFLGQRPLPALSHQKPAEILEWGVAHWKIEMVPKLSEASANSHL